MKGRTTGFYKVHAVTVTVTSTPPVGRPTLSLECAVEPQPRLASPTDGHARSPERDEPPWRSAAGSGSGAAQTAPGNGSGTEERDGDG